MWWFPSKPTPAAKATAFTLIETLLATALAATVMVAALGVLARFRGWRGARAEGDSPRAAAEAAVRVIEADLLTGRTVRLGSEQVEIEGFGWLDPATGAATQRPARIAYRVAGAGGRSWLIRRQSAPDEAGVLRATDELLCRGVARMELIEPAAPGDEPAQPARPVPGKEFAPVPEAVKLTLVLDPGPDAPARTIERIIALR